MATQYFQTLIDSNNKLSADLLDTTSSTSKTVTDEEKEVWNAKEDASNKVINISSSSTDTLYPSAKCVYTEVNTLSANITELDENKAEKSDLNSHIGNISNPHSVTKSLVGLNNVPNVSTNDLTPTYSIASTLAALVSGEVLSTAFGKIAKAVSDLISHISNKSNPHGVTISQIGAAASSHTHSYAGSSSVGGSATSAVKLDTSTAGSATQPCYFTGGKPTACSYSLNKTVPSNAVFTDTTYGVASTSANGLLLKLNNNASYFMNGVGAWSIPPNTTYSASTGLSLSGTTFAIAAGTTSYSYTKSSYINTVNGIAFVKYAPWYMVIYIDCNTTSSMSGTYCEYALVTITDSQYAFSGQIVQSLSSISCDGIGYLGNPWLTVSSDGKTINICVRHLAIGACRMYARAFIML